MCSAVRCLAGPWVVVAYRRPMAMSVTRMLCALAAAFCGAAILAAPAGATGQSAEIIGGSAAPAGAWPSIAYLEGGFHDSDGNEEEYACTGSVVAPQWIATAAHCTFGDGDQPPEWMRATLGAVDHTDPAAQRIAIDRFVPNPDYDPSNQIGDVGLVHLTLPTRQPPIPVATSTGVSAGRYSSPEGVPNAAGWGATNQRATAFTPKLQQAYLQLRSRAECGSLISGFDPATEICAGTAGATGACIGDSGGPLVEIDSATERPVLWGVTSWGPQVDEGLERCSLDLPAVFTWIPAYASFIQSTISKLPGASGSSPAAGEAPARSLACRRARATVRTARKRERRALRRLRAARRDRSGAAAPRRAQRRYRRARAQRRRAVAVAARRCRARDRHGASARGAPARP
jgi:secreted trypsin-like serine protease